LILIHNFPILLFILEEDNKTRSSTDHVLKIGYCTAHVNSSFFFEKQGKKFSFLSLEKSVQLIDFTCIVHVNMNNIFLKKN
jgi:hypothetical protein